VPAKPVVVEAMAGVEVEVQERQQEEGRRMWSKRWPVQNLERIRKCTKSTNGCRFFGNLSSISICDMWYVLLLVFTDPDPPFP
jgi:hypothetical protein